jgi:hypothetical protein
MGMVTTKCSRIATSMEYGTLEDGNLGRRMYHVNWETGSWDDLDSGTDISDGTSPSRGAKNPNGRHGISKCAYCRQRKIKVAC